MKWIATTVLTISVVLLPRGMARADSHSPPESSQPAAPPPATRPAFSPRVFQGQGFNNGPRQGFGPRFLLPFDQVKPTDQQIKDAEEFVQKYSPNHFAAYQAMNGKGEVGQFRDRIQTVIVRGYLDLKVLEANEPDLYQLKLDQIKVQDDIFGAIFRYRQLGQLKDNEKVRSELRDELRPLEQSLVDLRKDESKRRLKRIENAAERERSNLAQLEATGPTGIDNMVNQEIENGGRTGPFGGGRRRDREQDH